MLRWGLLLWGPSKLPLQRGMFYWGNSGLQLQRLQFLLNTAPATVQAHSLPLLPARAC